MKKIRHQTQWFLALLSILLVAMTAFILGAAKETAQTPDALLESICLRPEGQPYAIRLWQDEDVPDQWFFFLPAEAKNASLIPEMTTGLEMHIDDVVVAPGRSFTIPGEHHPLPLRIVFRGQEIAAGSVEFMCAEQTPSLHIVTRNGTDFEKVRADLSKKTLLPATYYGINPDGSADSTGQCTIGGRGNISWRKVETKKPYRLELLQEDGLFGMRDARKWTLLANYYDDTYLRNHIGFETARRLQCTDTPEDAFVNLYVNGDYHGLYQLTQKVDMDGGCIQTERGDNYQVEFNTEGWVNEGALTYESSLKLISVTWPKAMSESQWEDLTASIDRAEQSFLKNDGSYRDYVDEDSFVRQFLLHEVFLNKDVDFSSQFMMRKGDDPKWFAGPLWDFDRTFGAEEMKLRYNDTETQVMWIEGMTRGGSVESGWYKALYDIPSFRNALKRCYQSEFSDVLSGIITEIPRWEETLSSSVQMDYTRYGYDIPSYESSCDRLTGWLKRRKAFLDGFWNNEDAYLRIVFHTAQDEDNWHDMIFYTLPDIPVMQFPSGNGIAAWADADGRQILPGTAFAEDEELYPVYEE